MSNAIVPCAKQWSTYIMHEAISSFISLAIAEAIATLSYCSYSVILKGG